MTTASVIYHMEWLIDNLDHDHPLFSTELFRIYAGRPFNELVECHNWKPGDVMRATGIPPHVHILLNSSQMMDNFRALPDLVCAKVVQELEDRNQLFRNASRDEIQHIIMTCVQNALGFRPQNERAQNAEPAVAVARGVHPQIYYSGTSKASRLPPDFTLPTGNLLHAWMAYCCWDDRRNIPPLRAVFGHELRRDFSARFASYRTLMEAIVNKAVEQHVWVDSTDPVVVKNILNRVDLSEILPTTTPSGRVRRLDQIKWTTLVNDFYALRQQSQQGNIQPEADGDDDNETDDEHDP